MKEKKFKLNKYKLPLYLIYAFFIWYIIAFLIYPNIQTIVNVFYQEGQFTFRAFEKLFGSDKAMRSLRNSLILAPCLSLSVGVIGISLVLITEYFDVKGASVLRLGYMTTLIYGGVILVSGYKFVYSSNGYLTKFLVEIFPNFPKDWFQGFWAVLFVMTFAGTSNHMLFLRNAMRAVDFQTVEAARNMGASQFWILFQVVFPVLTPSFLAVTILTFLSGLTATAAPMMVGGTQFQTISPMLIQFSRMGSSKDLATLLAMFLGCATILLLSLLRKIENRGHYMSISKVKTRIVKQKIKNPIVNVLVHIYAYVLFVIYLLPVVLVILFSFTSSSTISQRKLSLSAFTLENYITFFSRANASKPFISSMVYSFLASLFVAVLVLVACRIMQKNKTKAAAALEYGLLIPWVLPSTLLAISLVSTYNLPRPWMFGQALTGTLMIMVIGYMLIKTPFTLRMTKAAFFSLDEALEDASRNLGAGTIRTFLQVVLPTIMPTILAIFALNFNSLLGEYDMSVFLYHPIMQPLGIQIKGLTDDMTNAGGLALTFVYAVFMMVIATIVLYLVYGRGEKIDVKKTNM